MSSLIYPGRLTSTQREPYDQTAVHSILAGVDNSWKAAEVLFFATCHYFPVSLTGPGWCFVMFWLASWLIDTEKDQGVNLTAPTPQQ